MLVIPSHIDGVEVNEIQYRFEDYPSLSGNDQTKELHIPSTIKMIGFQAFSEWTSLEKVVIDEGVTCIDTSSFSNCLNLKEINFPSTLRTIGAYAFNNCYRLSNIVFNDGLLDVQDRAFMYCISLKNIVIPESVEKMGFGVFEECTGIESIDFKTTKLVEFDGIVVRCRNLKSLVLPEGIVELGSCVELEQITYIEIPSTVKQIYNNCFAMCKSLETIWIRGCPTLIGDNLVSGYPGGVICFETERALSSWADFNKENYRVIYGVKEKPVNIEYQSISRPQEGQIRDSQFIPLYDSFGNLQEYYDTVQGVYYKVFDGEVAVIGYDGHGGNVYIPAYVHGLPVKSCATFEHPLFQGNGNITGLYLPGTLVEVQSDFFANMESLESVFIEDGTEKIFGYQFNSCKNLRSVRLPNTLKTIEYGAFGACERLMSITLPENLEVIERQAFAACQSFKYVTVPASVKVVEDMAFSSCWNLKGLYFEGIPTIGLDQVAYDDLATIYFKYSKDRYDLSGFETFFGPLVFDVSICPFE
ncbi:MAG: leucine-rich repeat domain-containing protein [Clostridia bacterium]|nr:leucine-rich repeat domain-containing protein [Clostridia bacterium]